MIALQMRSKLYTLQTACVSFFSGSAGKLGHEMFLFSVPFQSLVWGNNGIRFICLECYVKFKSENKRVKAKKTTSTLLPFTLKHGSSI